METGKGKSYLQGLLSRRRVMAGEKGQTTLHSINWSRKPQHDSFLMRNVSSELSRYSSLVETKFIFPWLLGNCWERTPLGKPQLQCWVFCKQKSNADTCLLLDPNWYFALSYPRLKFQVLFKLPLLGGSFGILVSIASVWKTSPGSTLFFLFSTIMNNKKNISDNENKLKQWSFLLAFFWSMIGS